MQEDLLHFDTDRETGDLAPDRHRGEQVGVARDARATIHPQRLATGRHEEQQPDVRIGQDVPHAVEPFVAGSIRNHEVRVVQHADESRGIALRRHVAASRSVGGCQQHERCVRDERAAVLVQASDLLLQRDLARAAEQRAEVGLGGHDVTEHRLSSQSIAACIALLTRSIR